MKILLERWIKKLAEAGSNTKKEVLDEMIGCLNSGEYDSLSLNEWTLEVHRNAIEHGWWDEERTLPELLCLIHSEISEALEEYRAHKLPHYEIDGKPEGIAVELVDAVIRIMDIFGKEGWDLKKLMEIKHEYNKDRPYKHGGKKI